MKKILLALFLIFALSVTGCTTVSENPNINDDFWTDISGDTLELAVEGQDMSIVLTKDGSASLSRIEENYAPAGDFGNAFAEFEAEIATAARYYGTFVTEGDKITLNLDYLRHDCLLLRGKDAAAFKEAYLKYCQEERPGKYDYVQAALAEGFVSTPSFGSLTFTFRRTGNSLALLYAKVAEKFSEYGTPVYETTFHENGAYTMAIYTDDSALWKVQEYDANDKCYKQTGYKTDGSIAYVDDTTWEGNTATTVRKDAEGNVLRITENIDEEYDGGTRIIERRTENGIVIYYRLYDRRNDGSILSTQDMIDPDDIVYHSFSVYNSTQDLQFHLQTRTERGTLVYYNCYRSYPDGQELQSREVTYEAETGVFKLKATFADGSENENEIPAADYVHGEWEKPDECK